jgi:GNAT superfamily N-acetyltransferase
VSSNAPNTSRPPVPWRLREGVETDVPGILECWAAAFAADGVEPMTPEHWRWKFLGSPIGSAKFFVADHDGRIVGYYAVIPQTFLIDGREHPGSIVVDVLTHPEYQRQGMFTKLGAYALAHCRDDPRFEFTTGYPIRPAVIPGHLKVGWRIRFQIGTWVQVLSAAAAIRAKVPLLRRLPGLAAAAGLAPTLACRAWSRLRLDGAARCRVERLDTADYPRFVRFFIAMHADLPRASAIQKRTPELFHWRYDGNPTHSYLYHVALADDGNAVGLAVTRQARLMGADCTVVADLLALPRRADRVAVLRRLVADIRGTALERGSALVAMMVTHPNPILPSPWKLGFVPIPYRFSFITRELAEQTAGNRDDLVWHLMWGDTDDV